MNIPKLISILVIATVITTLIIIKAPELKNIFNISNYGMDNQIKSLELQTSTQSQEDKISFSIEELRKRQYIASKIIIEQTLAPGINFNRYIASYTSDGLKIYGLLTIPNLPKPEKGFPAIVFLHGHLDPETYTTTGRYIAYQEGFAQNGFVTFKPDLRGHGKSEGEPVNASFSDGYTVDALNVIAAFKIDDDIDSNRIGIWGHSMGGGIALRALVVSKDIKAAIIWAGVVGNYQDLLERYAKRVPWIRSQPNMPNLQLSTSAFIQKYGSPSANPKLWSTIDPYNYLQNIEAPIELDHGTSDIVVPIEFSQHLRDALKTQGKLVEYFEYLGADHNIASPSFNLAMKNSVDFFKKYL